MSKILGYIALSLAVLALVAGCAAIPGVLQSPGDAVGLLRDQGFSHIQVTHKQIWFVSLSGCGRDDVVQWTFSAVNPRGQRVTDLHVCQGIFKGPTLRGN